MKALTRIEHIQLIPKRWDYQYQNHTPGTEKRLIGDRLRAAMPLTEKAADEIIGNKTWTSLQCSECRKDSQAVVIFGGDEESFYLCRPCLLRAAREIA